MSSDNFQTRHIGPRETDLSEMLSKIGVGSINELIEQTIPSDIRLKTPLNLANPMSEYEYLNYIKELASKNKMHKSFIGMGYYTAITPSVILRNIFENPSWYTSYTPYQAEISQGRLEALLNYQTMIMSLTGMEIANSSLLDEATAAAEAIIMMYNKRDKAFVKNEGNQLFVDEKIFPQTLDVLITRALAVREERNIADDNDIVVAAEILKGPFERFQRLLAVARRELFIGVGDALRRVEEAVARGIVAGPRDQRPDSLFGLGTGRAAGFGRGLCTRRRRVLVKGLHGHISGRQAPVMFLASI
jgi:glycine cleavage system pyridoxal-binding protein P